MVTSDPVPVRSGKMDIAIENYLNSVVNEKNVAPISKK
jgi:hypothetical protein